MQTDAVSSATKENLEWFQRRRNRWKNAPRPKVQSLTPQKPKPKPSTASSSTSSSSLPVETHLSVAPTNASVIDASRAMASNAMSATGTAAPLGSKSPFSFGASVTTIPSTQPQPSKPLFGATSRSIPTSNPNSFGSKTSVEPLTSATPLFGSSAVAPAPTVPSAPLATSQTTSQSVGDGGSIFANLQLTPSQPVAKPAPDTATRSIFSNIQLTLSKPVSSTTTTTIPSAVTTAPVSQPKATAMITASNSSGGGDGSTSIFGSIHLVPSSSQPATTTTTRAPTSNATNSGATSSTASIFSKINMTPSGAQSKPVFGSATTSSELSTASSTASIFSKINLTPSTLTTHGASEFKNNNNNNKASTIATASQPMSLSFGKPASTFPFTDKTPFVPVAKPEGLVRNSKRKPKNPSGASSTATIVATESVFPSINLTSSAPADITVTAQETPGGSIPVSANTNSFEEPLPVSNTVGSGESNKPSSSMFCSFPPTSTEQPNSLFGSTMAPGPNLFTFGATTAATASTKTSSMDATTIRTSSSTPVPVFGGMSLASKTSKTDISSSATNHEDDEVKTPPPTVSDDPAKSKLDAPTTVNPPAATSDDCNDHRSRLFAFYEKHNPEKLESVDATLEKYIGKEAELFRKLEAKYAPAPPASKYPLPSGDGPSCYIEFTVDGESIGKIVVKLFHDKAPLACDNFQALCTGSKGKKGRMGKPLCYKGCKVHRVVPTFCVQLGDFTKGDGTGGESIYEPNTPGVSDSMGRFKDEAFLQHSKKGLVSMANNGADRNGSQFFFTLRPCPSLDGKHVVFGEVTEGMNVVETIGRLSTNAKQRPNPTVEVTNCGEIVDGQEVACQEIVKAPAAPFGFGSSALGTDAVKIGGSGFGALAASSVQNNVTSFGFGVSASIGNASKASPFSFGATSGLSDSVNKTSPFSFGTNTGTTGSTKASLSSFGLLASTAKASTTGKPFGGSASTAANTTASTSPASSFGFGSKPSSTFGSTSGFSSSASSDSSTFSFGALASKSPDGGDSAFAFGASKPLDGASNAFSFAASHGATAPVTSTFRSAKVELSDSDDDSNSSDKLF